MQNPKRSSAETDKNELLARAKAHRAVHILRENLSDIPDVQTWASVTGYSRNWLILRMKEEYDQTPMQIIRQFRYESIISGLLGDLDRTAYSIAIECGFRNESALSKFLRKHYDTTLRDLRVDIIQSRIKIQFQWVAPQLTNGK